MEPAPPFVQHSAAQLLGLDRQAPALVVAKAQPSIAELLPRCSVLFLEVVDDILLLVRPAREKKQHQLKGIECQTNHTLVSSRPSARRTSHLRAQPHLQPVLFSKRSNIWLLRGPAYRQALTRP